MREGEDIGTDEAPVSEEAADAGAREAPGPAPPLVVDSGVAVKRDPSPLRAVDDFFQAMLGKRPDDEVGPAPSRVVDSGVAMTRRTINASDNAGLIGGAKARNNGRYNGDGRHWETPPEVFDPLHAMFNFTIDVCATPETAKVPRFFQEPGPWLSQGGVWDALSRSWAGERAWMNPPYGAEIYAWTRKARLEAAGALVVGLLPASTDLAWWHEDVMGCCAQGANPRECKGLAPGQQPIADVLRWYRGRIRFLTGGPYRASGFFPSVAVIWGRTE